VVAAKNNPWFAWLGVLVGAVAVLLLGVAGVESATLGLAVAASALVFCLITLYRMVRVLGRPAIEFDLERDGTIAAAGHKQLRDEKRRLLRAINELEFDHSMGKLSNTDYEAVRRGYELRAIEVMRGLEAEPVLHPDLERELVERGLIEGVAPAKATEEAAPAEEPAEEPGATRTCASCEGVNERDAKFCKHCGKELAA
jgi:hypothetical protein